MGKNIILCFDGTTNDPEDAEQEESLKDGVKDSSITNIFKLHLLFGGDLEGGKAFGAHQTSLYFAGVGTYGNRVKKVINTLIAPEKSDVNKIIKRAGKKLAEIYEDDDQIFLFGFSRGAALARRFASIFNEKFFPTRTTPIPVRFLGVFDTVASIGLPNLDKNDKPRSDVVFENNQISDHIQEALHILALDEKRLAFRPTLMKQDKKVTEIWFPGAHADVGGGYYKDGLSDVTLSFMLNEFHRRQLGLLIRSPEEIDYDEIDTEDVDIDYDDMIIEPNPLAISHQQKRPPLTSRLTLAHRKVEVDGPGLPVIHPSVAERIYGNAEYRPASLRKLKHGILNPHDGTITAPVNGLKEHLQKSSLLAKPMNIGDEKPVIVQSPVKMNRAHILIEAGAGYRFKIDMTQQWRDASILCGPDGWKATEETIEDPAQRVFIRSMQPFRRHPDADWFEVIGIIGDNKGEKVRPLAFTEQTWTPQSSGELFLFANDMDRMYGNNTGSITVILQRVS